MPYNKKRRYPENGCPKYYQPFSAPLFLGLCQPGNFMIFHKHLRDADLPVFCSARLPRCFCVGKRLPPAGRPRCPAPKRPAPERSAVSEQSTAVALAFCTKREQMSYSKSRVHNTLSAENIATGSAPSAFFAPCRLQGDFVCSIRRAGKSTALRALPATQPTSSHLERPMSAPPGIASRPDERPELVPSMGPAPLDHMSRLRRHA